MRNAHPKYLCFPSVVCVGRETEVTIFPRDISRIFREDNEYDLAVVGLYDDQLLYRESVPHDHPCYVKDGCLHFTFTPEYEQEYSIRFSKVGDAEIRIPLYAVDEDLYALRPLKGDLHSHSYYSDGIDGLAMTPADYREEGFDFFALTDHNRLFPSEECAALYRDIPLGIHMMLGEEIHPPVSSIHIVGIGETESVANFYIHHPEEYEAVLDELEPTFTNLPAEHRRRAAMVKWACDAIRKAGGIAILPHPFWRPNRYNYAKVFLDFLFDEHLFDALEVIGGIAAAAVNCPAKFNNMQVALWQEQASKGNALPVVGSSDSHNHDFSKGGFGRNFTMVFAKDNTTEAILEAIRNGYSVAGEVPLNADGDIRFYGSQVRLVAFAHFLYENYFNETWRLCIGEGILMRRYAQGEPVEELLAALADTVPNFYKQFYGLLPAPSLSAERVAFLDECRTRQIEEGPLSNGGVIKLYGNNDRRL